MKSHILAWAVAALALCGASCTSERTATSGVSNTVTGTFGVNLVFERSGIGQEHAGFSLTRFSHGYAEVKAEKREYDLSDLVMFECDGAQGKKQRPLAEMRITFNDNTVLVHLKAKNKEDESDVAVLNGTYVWKH